MPTQTCLETVRELLRETPAECFDGKLSAAENGRKFTIERPKGSKEEFCRIKVDGCAMQEGERCDYLFYRCATGDAYFVELKDSQNLKKAVSQITASVKQLAPALKCSKAQIFGFAILRESPPRHRPETQKLHNEFQKKVGTKLKVYSQAGEHKIQ